MPGDEFHQFIRHRFSQKVSVVLDFHDKVVISFPNPGPPAIADVPRYLDGPTAMTFREFPVPETLYHWVWPSLSRGWDIAQICGIKEHRLELRMRRVTARGPVGTAFFSLARSAVLANVIVIHAVAVVQSPMIENEPR